MHDRLLLILTISVSYGIFPTALFVIIVCLTQSNPEKGQKQQTETYPWKINSQVNIEEKYEQ